MPNQFLPENLRPVLATVDRLIDVACEGERRHAHAIEAVAPSARASAQNLAHYLAVRSHDLRRLQADLRNLSLSSLGRMESNVLETVRGVRMALQALVGELPPVAQGDDLVPALTSDEGDRRLSANAERLLGASPSRHATRIMVTLPATAAEDPDLVRSLIRAGMTVARINLAHDEPAAWTAMVAHVREAQEALGLRCRVLADLPGPKLRTGELAPGPRVLRVRPARDAFGVVASPATVSFIDPGAASAAVGETEIAKVPLAHAIASQCAPGDELRITDSRGRKRRFTVVAVEGGRCRAVTDRTSYLGSGCRVELRRGRERLGESRIGAIAAQPLFLPLQRDDLLTVTRDPGPGRLATVNRAGVVEPASIPCTLPEVFADVSVGDRILFDDGKIRGAVEVNDGDNLRVRITAVPPGGGRLRAEKGINLPDTEMTAPALGDQDAPLLDWLARHADMVSLSFVNRPEDVELLRRELAERDRDDAGIVLKIETAVAFERLPELLFAGMKSPPLGVMVARGDLAAELGYARLGEVQEEILWLCEAAHVPVIWATQVLDSMARTGQPSRAEVTDAGMGGRAECVMLNKGPYIVETVQFLGNVLERMQQHQLKKRAQLRRLRVADDPATEADSAQSGTAPSDARVVDPG